jgi:hypothetical protein
VQEVKVIPLSTAKYKIGLVQLAFSNQEWQDKPTKSTGGGQKNISTFLE